jgi:hypothetical protein
MPDWIWISTMILSPTDTYQTSIFLGFDLQVADISGFTIIIPDFITMVNLLVIITVWIVMPLAVGYHFYRKRDI